MQTQSEGTANSGKPMIEGGGAAWQWPAAPAWTWPAMATSFGCMATHSNQHLRACVAAAGEHE
jgi:hypothetical protein